MLWTLNKILIRSIFRRFFEKFGLFFSETLDLFYVYLRTSFLMINHEGT